MMKKSIAALIILLPVFFTIGCRTSESDLERAIAWQLERFPASHLQDIYKSFFQDRFGPGHLLEDTAAARAYFEDELAGMTSRGHHEKEPCGTGDQFYRVSMDLVKDGQVSADLYFRTFLAGADSFRSAGNLDDTEMEAWKKEWRTIVAAIERMKIDLPEFQNDKARIEQMLGRGELVVHHSVPYTESYDPHYRIFRKELLHALGL